MRRKKRGLGVPMRAALATALAAVLVVTAAPAAVFADSGSAGKDYSYDFGDMDKLSSKCDADGYFTLLAGDGTKLEKNKKKTFSDGFESRARINFKAAGDKEKDSISFKTADKGQMTVWWQAGAVKRSLSILDESGKAILTSTEGDPNSKDTPLISKFTIPAAGQYYLTCSGGGKSYVFKVAVHEGEIVRGAWDKVAAPTLKTATQKDGSIIVTADAAIGADGGDTLAVEMLDKSGKTIDTKNAAAAGTEQSVTFTPSASGTYSFKATLSRDKEKSTKAAKETISCAFTLPLAASSGVNTVNRGAGKVGVSFYSVKEATGYTLSIFDAAGTAVGTKDFTAANGADKDASVEYDAEFEGLAVGQAYTASVVAKRGADVSAPATAAFTVTAAAEQEWRFSAFGSNVTTDTKYCGHEGSFKDGKVVVWNTNNKGKLVPASTDGLSFYYTAVPADKNFTLTATATPDSWALTNGQEGFGLMAADRVGTPGDTAAFWNNSYMASATKVEYYFDPATNQVTDDKTKNKISMKLGIGSQEKSGVTAANLDALKGGDLAGFSSKMTTLESSCGKKGAGTYNIIGGWKDSSTTADAVSSVKFTIQKNNTGYFVSYTDAAGKTTTQKYYNTKALEQIDKDNVYVGFFAARAFKVTFTDISLQIIDPKDDAPAEDRPTEYVTPSYQVLSATTANKAAYTLTFRANADGVLNATDANGAKIADNLSVKSGKNVDLPVTLAEGKNNYVLNFAPKADFHPSGLSYKKLSSYDPATINFTVDWKKIGDGNSIYVAPKGKADAAGSEKAPVDIYTAVKYAAAGQSIILKPDTYKLSSTVLVARGIDGTASNPIRMQTSSGRAVFDFQKKCEGFNFVGSYWQVKNIDVKNSANALDGIRLSGSHNTFEGIHTYNNGNTGFQISRYAGTDSHEQWPSYNLVKNCTSYANADKGYEDADGFAAKLTVGPGNVFDGCISYNNADDGWDLFAKVETGPIGAVTIQNCLAFNNGYGLDGKEEGNGNGFKMGGSSITGYHHLINSVAFGNKAKGIDSNSCPDIQVTNCTSFNNGSYNVAFYTNDTKDTDYCADGLISFRTNKGEDDQFKLKGSQSKAKVYTASNFYMMGGKSQNYDGKSKKAITLTESMFRSTAVPAKDSYKDKPLSVAEGFRATDGSIYLGDLLQLTDAAKKTLAEAGIDTDKLGAKLDGKQHSYATAADITGAEAGKNTGWTANGKSIPGVSLYRLLNAWTGEHFFTTDEAEKTACMKSGWIYEGIAGSVATKSDTPVYRLHHDGLRMHFYTTGKAEVEALEKQGWKSEGIAFYSAGDVAVYRTYDSHSTNCNHMFTAHNGENDAIKGMGWKSEGIAWYAYE